MLENIHYHPEAYGLTVVGDIQWGWASYDFDMTIVWQDADGKLYWASDSGCSCPTPFEDFQSLEDLETGGSFQCAKAITDRFTEFSENGWHGEQEVADTGAQVFALLDKLMKL